jgi:outer membrane protein assembly factor BamB
MSLRTVFISIGILLLLSCSRSVTPGKGGASLVIYPPPPDTTRIQFLTKISSSTDVTGRHGWFRKFILGSDVPLTIGKPYGVTIYKGKIYVSDAVKRGFNVIDLNKNKFSDFIPDGKGALKAPLNCAFDERGYLFVADADRKQIVVFDEKGDYYTSFGEKENFKPTDVVIADGKVWVCNLAGHQINVYSKDSTYTMLRQFPNTNKDSTGYLFSPTNLFVTKDMIYVTDFGDFKIKRYNHAGDLIDTIGTYGESVGQFARPKGIAVDRESNMYAVDAGFENVQIFNKDGKLLMFFGGSYKGPGDMWLPAKVAIDYDNLSYFEKYVDPSFHLKYIVLVTNQFGPDKLNIYGAVEPMTPALKKQKKK